MSKYKVVHDIELDRIEVWQDGELIGECEGYEVDAICGFLEVEYVEEEL